MKLLLDVISHEENNHEVDYAAVEITDELRTFVKSVQKDVIPDMRDRLFLLIEFMDASPTFYSGLPWEFVAHEKDSVSQLPDDCEIPAATVGLDICTIVIYRDEICWRVTTEHTHINHSTVSIKNKLLFDDGFEDRVLDSLGS